jgi:hypothetical protein
MIDPGLLAAREGLHSLSLDFTVFELQVTLVLSPKLESKCSSFRT